MAQHNLNVYDSFTASNTQKMHEIFTHNFLTTQPEEKNALFYDISRIIVSSSNDTALTTEPIIIHVSVFYIKTTNRVIFFNIKARCFICFRGEKKITISSIQNKRWK